MGLQVLRQVLCNLMAVQYSASDESPLRGGKLSIDMASLGSFIPSSQQALFR
jgi:hypothetical protein